MAAHGLTMNTQDAANAGTPAIEAAIGDTEIRLKASGEWLINRIVDVNAKLREIEALPVQNRVLRIDMEDITAFDTSGAWIINRLVKRWKKQGGEVELLHQSEFARRLMDAAWFDSSEVKGTTEKSLGILRLLEKLGKLVLALKRDTEMGLNVIGAAVRGPQMKLGRRGGIRPISIVHHIDRMGLRAVPIITLMSFLIGAIVAQQSAFQLRFFGLEVWAVDLVSVLLLREVGVLLTAIMIAGRSGSAMTAEIGSMKMREEVDALTVIGLNPIGVLVFPRLVALTIALPLLTFLANMAALAGAALILRFYSDISFDDFILRVRAFVDLSTVFSGLIKAPFMAMIIGTMAAIEGMKVEGSAESLGRRTTAAVVKAIFFVIVVDGLFAIFYAAIDY